MLRKSYTLLAPFYDWIVARPTRKIRCENIQQLASYTNRNVLITGIGTGLDIPYLPAGPNYFANDLTWAMLQRAHVQSVRYETNISLQQADAMNLPYSDNSFDAAVLHLILAVVPDPLLALRETARVVKPGGTIFILDKFIKLNERAYFRRFLNLLLQHIATRTDVVFEPLLAQCSNLILVKDEAALLRGWFRLIRLIKTTPLS